MCLSVETRALDSRAEQGSKSRGWLTSASLLWFAEWRDGVPGRARPGSPLQTLGGEMPGQVCGLSHKPLSLRGACAAEEIEANSSGAHHKGAHTRDGEIKYFRETNGIPQKCVSGGC